MNNKIENLKQDVRNETSNHCNRAYQYILPQEVINITISYWNERTDKIIDEIVDILSTQLNKKICEK